MYLLREINIAVASVISVPSYTPQPCKSTAALKFVIEIAFVYIILPSRFLRIVDDIILFKKFNLIDLIH